MDPKLKCFVDFLDKQLTATFQLSCLFDKPPEMDPFLTGSRHTSIEAGFFVTLEPGKNPGWLGYIETILPSYIGIVINPH